MHWLAEPPLRSSHRTFPAPPRASSCPFPVCISPRFDEFLSENGVKQIWDHVKVCQSGVCGRWVDFSLRLSKSFTRSIIIVNKSRGGLGQGWGQAAQRRRHCLDRDGGAGAESQAALGIPRMASSLREVPKTERLLAECSGAVKAWTWSRPQDSL